MFASWINAKTLHKYVFICLFYTSSNKYNRFFFRKFGFQIHAVLIQLSFLFLQDTCSASLCIMCCYAALYLFWLTFPSRNFYVTHSYKKVIWKPTFSQKKTSYTCYLTYKREADKDMYFCNVFALIQLANDIWSLYADVGLHCLKPTF